VAKGFKLTALEKMIYPENFEQKTGFDQVRNKLFDNCISSLGRHWVEKMKFTSSHSLLLTLLDQTEEFRQIIITHEIYPSTGFYDPMQVFERIKLEGTFPEPEELVEIRSSLSTITELVRLLQSKKTEENLKYPALCRLTDDIYIEPAIVKEIDRIIDEKGEVRSNASPKLAEIRRSLSQLENQALKRINQLFAQAKKEGWIDSNSELVLRNGRQVLPVPVAFKRKIKGFVHDQSTTGQTVFLEPEEVFETNNEIRQLELDERREIVRILKELADFLRPWLPQLIDAYLFLGKIDFIRSKAILAVELQASRPQLHNEPVINWIRARHPLLYLSFKQQKKHVEPLSIELSAPKTIIVISGPNAGGKSVCLKTIGLVQYMLQCGLLVPMEDHSDAGIFKDIMIDIGDEQSIENDLSTYSSHLANMCQFLKRCDSKSLFLIDEFGAGTEPRLGGAIAEAILTKLSKQKSYGVVTTHYANLKILAGKDAGIVNGSMLFDTQNMKPLYRLKTGNPGSSFAFEIARSMGLPGDILQTAEKIAGSEHIDFDRQLQDLELKKMELDEKEKQLRAGDNFLTEMIEKYQKLNDELETRKGEIVQQAKMEAKKILAESNRIIEKTIKEIRESSADKEKTRKLRENIQEYTKQFSDIDNQISESRTQKKKKQKLAEAAIKPEVVTGPVLTGDFVRIKGQETPGEVIETTSKEALVAFGSVQMKISLQKLEKLSKKSVKLSEPSGRVKYDFDINEKAAEFNPNLDVRGQRAQEALLKVRRFVDDAILLGNRNLKVVHGTGDGILREALRDYLRTIPEVKRARDEHPDRGGSGCTLIEIDTKNS
jgi:DNA mismatch repair protein MutS2